MVDPPNGAAAGIVRICTDYFWDHLDKPIECKVAAADCGISYHRMLRAFKSATGFTPRQYLLELRCRVIRLMLLGNCRQDGVTVTGLLQRYQIKSAGRFSRLYKKRYGETPHETLARCKENVTIRDAKKGILRRWSKGG